MKVRVKISQTVKKYFDQYGTLSYCVNRLFDEWKDDALGLTTSSTSVGDNELCTTTVDITSPYYVAYRDAFDARHKFVSISRLLTYAYSIDHCSNWEKRSQLTDILYRIQKLPQNELNNLIKILKEKYT